MSEDKFYSVKEVADKTGLSEHTIRYYTNLGLIPNLSRNNNHYRMFDQEALDTLLAIKCLRGTGMSLKDIKRYMDLVQMGDSTVPTRYNIILKQKESVKNKLKEVNKQLDFVNYKLSLYKEKMKMGD